VYNTFNTTALTSPNYFALYNKFRGLLRFYLYLPPGSPVPSTYINHGLSLSGAANSSLLNYISGDVVDLANNVRNTTNIEKYQVQSTGSWYAFQYELAYDPNIPNLTYQDLNLSWNTAAVSVSQVNLYGNIDGAIKGTISQPASTPSFAGAVQAVTLGGFKLLSSYAITGGTAAAFGLPEKVFNALKGSVNNFFQGGKVSNILNAIFGGGGGSTQQVNLTLNAKIGLDGTITSVAGLSGNQTVIIPGITYNSSAAGYAPAYTQPLGVFNLSAKPKINVRTTSVRLGDRGGGNRVTKEFFIDQTSFNTLINPAVSAEATISNIKQEIVLINPYHLNALAWSTDGILEEIGAYNKVYTNATKYVTDRASTFTFDIVGIRFTFDVTPNNGSPKVTIVKTFAADQVAIP
ncbi:MAG: hypothetical protein WCF67_20235, partial [Chitinophagaceae bacterium]